MTNQSRPAPHLFLFLLFSTFSTLGTFGTLVSLHAGCAEDPPDPGSTGGAAGAGGAGVGGANGVAMVCEPWSKKPCYSGPPETKNIGDCLEGFSFCNAVGTDWSYCEGEVTPAAETCKRPGDENCDGVANEGCP